MTLLLWLCFCLLRLSGSSAADKEPVQLKLLQWDLMEPYEAAFEAHAKKQGLAVDLHLVKPYLLELSDVYNGIRSGKGDVVLTPSEVIKQDGKQLQQLLLPMDTRRLPNYPRIVQSLRQGHKYLALDSEGGRRYGVPYRADVYSLLYNADKVKQAPASYAALWDPQHKGKVGMWGIQDEWHARAALLGLGYPLESVYDMSTAKVSWPAVTAKLTELVRTTHSVHHEWYPDPERLAGCDLFDGYGQLLAHFRREGLNWEVAILDTGTELWVDEFCISKRLKGRPEALEAAYLLIDYMLTDDMQVHVYEDQGYIPVCDDAFDILNRRGVKAALLKRSTYDNDKITLTRHQDKRTKNTFKLMWESAVNAAGRTAEFFPHAGKDKE